MDNRSSTLSRYGLLKRALEGGKNIPTALTKACRSQGGLARLDLSSEGISPMSLNTLKACANMAIENGGWTKLDEMRRSILDLSSIDKDTKKTRLKSKATESKERQERLQEALENERRYRIRLQVAYDELLAKVRGLAKSDLDLANYLNRHVIGYSFKRLSIADSGRNES